jgi:hypothetical protein
MHLGRFTLGYIATTTAAAVVGILFIKWVAGRWPRIPVAGGIARAL